MKKILFITTGGTISSIKSDNGLIPTNSEFIEALKLIDNTNDYTHLPLFSLDSSNMQPEEWVILANTIYNNLQDYDGIIITHGTDTMAYTTSIMCYMIQNPNIPIVFTGSQLPIFNPLTDAYTNLRCALAMATSDIPGIFLAFNKKVILGSRAVKIRTSSFDAFDSINLEVVARVNSHGLTINKEALPYTTKKPVLNTKIDTNVFLLKLTPNTDPKILDILYQGGIKGIVIEAFGIGGISYIRRDFVKAIRNLIDKGMPICLCSQCLYEESNFNIYEVGKKVIETGAIEASDMTTEAAISKLMWALGQTNNLNEIRKIFKTPIASDLTN